MAFRAVLKIPAMTTALQLGDPKLDGEHAELQRLIERLLAASPAEILPALDALKTHAATHFGDEDTDLRRIGNANATCHLDEHAAVLKSLGEVRDIVARAAPASETEQNLVRRLGGELVRWLPEHVQQMDAGIAHVRTQERFGGVPVQITRPPRS
jgi:hemerythrin